MVHKIICKKTFYQRKIDLEQFSDEEQHSRFGLSLELIKYVIETLTEDLQRQTLGETMRCHQH